jgi:hypothetical protein
MIKSFLFSILILFCYDNKEKVKSWQKEDYLKYYII